MHSTRATAYALSLLSSASSARVQGVFAHGFDLLLNTGNIVYVGEKNKPLSANGIALDRALFTPIYQAIQDTNQTDSQADVLFTYLKKHAFLGEKINASAHALEHPHAVFTLATELSHMSIPPAGIALPDTVSRTLLATGQEPNDTIMKSLEWLYGRGPGLTPSGDDIISAYVVGLIWAGQDTYIEQLKNMLSELRIYRHTTYASDALLDASFAGALSEPFFELQLALDRGEPVSQALSQVLEIGHHSGADMLCGLMFACKMLEERCQSAL